MPFENTGNGSTSTGRKPVAVTTVERYSWNVSGFGEDAALKAVAPKGVAGSNPVHSVRRRVPNTRAGVPGEVR